MGMEGIMLLCGLLGALAVALGIASLVAWVIDRREEQGIKAIRDASFVAQAQAEFLPTPSRLRHLEIEASKRGDLLAAANLAELDDYRWLDSQRFAYARDDEGFLDPALLAPCDEAAFYGWDEEEASEDTTPGYAEFFLDDSATDKPSVRHA
jgi:hypothetical protein